VAELTVFGFRPAKSLLHRVDVRFKILFLILISIASLGAGLPGIFTVTLLFTAVTIYLGISHAALLKTVRYFLLLLVFVFAARVFSVPGETVWEAAGLTASMEGIYEGALVCMRLWMLVLLGLCFIVTSRPSEVRSAVAWCLKPIPLVPGERVATMLGLVIRFIPVIFDQAAKTGEAQRARGVERRKNPFFRVKAFLLPFMRRLLEDADRLVTAMAARGYTEGRTGHAFSVGAVDWALSAAVLLICILLLAS
jgi:energy-coupling factor transporter transmembrane protein EcfT